MKQKLWCETKIFFYWNDIKFYTVRNVSTRFDISTTRFQNNLGTMWKQNEQVSPSSCNTVFYTVQCFTKKWTSFPPCFSSTVPFAPTRLGTLSLFTNFTQTNDIFIYKKKASWWGKTWNILSMYSFQSLWFICFAHFPTLPARMLGQSAGWHVNVNYFTLEVLGIFWGYGVLLTKKYYLYLRVSKDEITDFGIQGFKVVCTMIRSWGVGQNVNVTFGLQGKSSAMMFMLLKWLIWMFCL